MNLSDNLGSRCELMKHRRSPYPPRAWMELPNTMYPVVSDPERCRRIEEETQRRRNEQARRVDEFHDRVVDRIRRLNLCRDCDFIESRDQREEFANSVPPPISPGRSRSLSPELAFLEGLPPAHSVTPTCTAPRLPRSAAMSEEERQMDRIKTVRSSLACRNREQARQWREDTARKQHLAEIRRRQRCLEKMREEAMLEERRMDYLRKLEISVLEKESKIYATELKRLVATRLLRRISVPIGNFLTVPYDAEHPFGLVVLPIEVRQQLRRLPPLCPCVEEWWETNPDKCECALRDNWSECVQGLEKLMAICVHGSDCF